MSVGRKLDPLVVQTLVRAGASTESLNDQGHTPEKLARLNNNDAACNFLFQVRRVRKAALRGDLEELCADITLASPTLVWIPARLWVHLLPPRARQDLVGWASASRKDMRAAYVALYLPSAAAGDLNAALGLTTVAHDGHRHLQKAISLYLVYPHAGTRRIVNEIALLPDRAASSVPLPSSR